MNPVSSRRTRVLRATGVLIGLVLGFRTVQVAYGPPSITTQDLLDFARSRPEVAGLFPGSQVPPPDKIWLTGDLDSWGAWLENWDEWITGTCGEFWWGAPKPRVILEVKIWRLGPFCWVRGSFVCENPGYPTDLREPARAWFDEERR